MAGNELLVTLGLNTGNFSQQLRGINAEIKKTESEFIKAGAGIKNFEQSTNGMKSNLSKLNSQYQLNASKLGVYKKEMQKTGEIIEKTKNRQSQLKQKLSGLNRAYADATRKFGANSHAALEVKERIEAVNKEFARNEKVLLSASQKMRKYKTESNLVSAEMKKAAASIKALNSQVKPNVWMRMGNNLETTGNRFKKVGGHMNSVANQMAKFTVPLAVMGAGIIKVAGDFESGMSEVQAISGATGDDLNKLKAKAEEMGAKTKFSATESAAALKYMAMAGWKTNEMLDGLPGVMNLAAASGEDLALTSDIVTDALTAFGLKASDATHFADILASASSNSNTNVAMLGESFKYCAPVCGALGMKASDTAVALGLMANAGIKGSTAGTVLRTTFTNLAKPTDTVKAAMKKLNLSLTDTHGKVKPLSILMEELRSKMGGLDKATQAEVAASLAGKEAMSGLLAIVNASPADYEKLTKAIKNCDGVSQQMADTMNNNLKGQWTLFKSQLEGVAIQLGETLLPIAKQGLDMLSRFVDWFSKLSPEMQETIVKTAAFAVAGNAVLKVGAGVVDNLGSLALGASKVSKWFGRATVATESLGAASTLTMGAAGAGGTSGLLASIGGFAAAAGPWILAAGAIVAAGYGIYECLNQEVIPEVDLFADKIEVTGTKMSHGRRICETETTKISDSTKKLVGHYMDLDKQVGESLMNLSSKTVAFTTEMKGSIVTNIQDTLMGTVGISNDTAYKITSNMSNLCYSTDNLTSQTKESMISQYREMLDQTTSISEEQKNTIIGHFSEMLEKDTELTSEQTNQIVSQFQTMAESINSANVTHRNKDLEDLTRYFKESNTLTDTNEQEILNKVKGYYDQREKNINDSMTRIKQIYETAAKEHRNTTQQENQEVSKIREEMKKTAIRNMSENQKESQIILDRMKSYDGRITAEMARDHIKELNKARDKSIDAANAEYREKESTYNRMADELGVITREQANALIKEAERQRDGTVNAAKQTRNDAVDTIFGMNSELASNVDSKTGEIISWWNRMFTKWDKWSPQSKNCVVTTTERTIREIVEAPIRKYFQPQSKPNWHGTNFNTMLYHGPRRSRTVFEERNPEVRSGLNGMAVKGGYMSPNSIQSSQFVGSYQEKPNASTTNGSGGSGTNGGSQLIELIEQVKQLIDATEKMSKKPTQVSLELDGRIIANKTVGYLDNEMQNKNNRENYWRD